MFGLSQLNLLKNRQFLPVFMIQLLGAFNDNIFRNALIVLIAYQFTFRSTELQELSITLAAGLFILPFLLFSALAGQLADKFSKKRLIIIIKIFEVILMLLATIAFYMNALGLLMLVLFFMGMHSTFFGPIKFAILPDILQKKDLLNANALIEASTFIAILIGTLMGGFLVVQHQGIFHVSCIMLITATIGLITSFFVAHTPNATSNLAISVHFIKSSFEVIKQVKAEKKVFWSILGISWFWLIGATMLTQLPNFAKNILHADAHVVTIFIALFTVGIAGGSLLCGYLLKQKISLQWLPLSLLFMSIFLVDLFLVSRYSSLNNIENLISFSHFFSSAANWRICVDLLGLALSAGIYIVPLYTLLQTATASEHRARSIGANNIVNALFIVLASLLTLLLLRVDVTVPQIFLLLGIFNAGLAVFSIFKVPEGFIKPLLRWILRRLYKVKLTGGEHYKAAGDRVVIVANHTSFLDVVLLYAFLPDDLVFAINRFTAQVWWIRPFLYFAQVFEIDPINPIGIKTLIHEVKKPGKCVIFPEGRITTTGALMKIYEGPGLIADHARANLLPIRIQGAQYTPFSRLRGKVRIRWFPQITLTILPPRRFIVDPKMSSRKRRQHIGTQLYEIMEEMLFQSTDYKKTLFESLLEAKAIHKGPTKILEDIKRVPINYNQMLLRCFMLAPTIKAVSAYQEVVGLLLPNMIGTVITFFALQAYGRIPALLNYSGGVAQLIAACYVAQIRCVLTSRQFIESANLFDLIQALSQEGIQLVFLEDVRKKITLRNKLSALAIKYFASYYYHKKLKRETSTHDPAVILFTSGSEGQPKAVVLSHENIQANLAQMSTQIDFNQRDIFFSALPIFHAFGLTACVILPLYHGIKTFIYPSPLHYRKVPNMIYECNATITFGTDTFLAGYGRFAHPYDFYSIRYVFAGAEKLKEKTRKLWMEKFGIRIFEGYGVTEASPVVSLNTPMRNKPGTVGNFLPGIRYEIQPVPHIKGGGRLYISGPNIMLGYLNPHQLGEIIPPKHGWYDTGDIVEVNENGYLIIKDRAKRFAKISGEMISLTAIENIIYELWPDNYHALVSIPDEKKGEQLILVTDYQLATRNDLHQLYKKRGLSELGLPRAIFFIKVMPMLASGKVDYRNVQNWLKETKMNATMCAS